VSVCGTVVQRLKLRGFSWEQGIRHFRWDKPTLVNTPRLSHADLPTQHVYTLEPGRPTPGRHNLLRPPIASLVGAGILTRFPSATTLVLTLGADSPCADARGAGNLGLSATRTFTLFIATHVSIRTSDTSSKGHPSPSPAYGTLSYHSRSQKSEDRSRKQRIFAISSFYRCLAASWQFPDIRHANAARSQH
jgi:hypothetical protein